MKKLFSKILSTSIMFLCCMLSFVSFVKADGPDWLDPRSPEYTLFFKLSEEAQEKLIDLHKKIINMNGNRYGGGKRKLFFVTLKLIDSLAERPSKETDPQILPIVTGYLKKDNIVYINISVLEGFTKYNRGSINVCLQEGMNLKAVNSLDKNVIHHVQVQQDLKLIEILGRSCSDPHYTRRWSIRVSNDLYNTIAVQGNTLRPMAPAPRVAAQKFPWAVGYQTFSTIGSSNDQLQIPTRMPFVPINTVSNTGTAVQGMTSGPMAPAPGVAAQRSPWAVGYQTFSTVGSSNDQPQIPTRMPFVPINTASDGFASQYVYPRFFLNKHPNTENSFD